MGRELKIKFYFYMNEGRFELGAKIENGKEICKRVLSCSKINKISDEIASKLNQIWEEKYGDLVDNYKYSWLVFKKHGIYSAFIRDLLFHGEVVWSGSVCEILEYENENNKCELKLVKEKIDDFCEILQEELKGILEKIPEKINIELERTITF